MSKKQYTKESIKARMFSRIATLWDIKNIDALDPVVKLMVESLASEIFRLSGEIEDIEDRVVEKLARAFTPSFMMSASPAHAVGHARAAGKTCTIDRHVEFGYKNPNFLQRHNLRKLAFTPVHETTLINGDVVSMIAGGRYYNVTAQGGKEHTANSLRRDPVFNRTVWIGLDLNRRIEQIRNLPFYFEFPLMDDSEEYRRLLGYGKWSHNGSEIASVSGFRQPDDEPVGFGAQNRELFQGILSKYKDQFVTLCDTLHGKDLKWERFPQELTGLFDESFVAALADELVWLKVVFPPAFDYDALFHVAVHTNCFLVSNIYKKQNITTVTKLSSIIPMGREDNEYFLFVDSVTDSRNRLYKQVRNHNDDDSTGSYMVRYGGSERFNEINAHDFLERLLDKYREESIAFSGTDIDVLVTFENLTAYLDDFERRLHSLDRDNEHTSYIILGDGIKERTNLTVSYDVTNGTTGNGIRKSEPLEIPQKADVDPTSAVLMTTTRGGRKSPSESSQRYIYQYLLTSRDRVYTKEDMRSFCRAFYGDYFTQVEVENGYEVSNKPKEGIIRTTNIILSGALGRSDVEPAILKRDILAGLIERSPDEINYRIVLK